MKAPREDGGQHIKKSYGVLCKREPVKYTFILAELMMYPMPVVCPMLGVTQSGFHFWRRREPSMREQERERLSVEIRGVFDANRGRYGAPRIHKAMCERHGYTGSLNRLQVLMRTMGLRAKAGRKFKMTTDSAHQLPIESDSNNSRVQNPQVYY